MDFYAKIKENRRKSIIMLLISFILLGGVAGVAAAYLYGGFEPISFSTGAALGFLLVGIIWLSSTRITLRLNHAKEVTQEQYPKLHNVVEEMALAAGVPKPRVYVIQDPAMNAFATGKSAKDGHVAFTTGLLEAMDREQLQAIAAHEIAHVKNEDIKLMTIVAAVASAIVIIADIASRFVWFGGGNNRSNNSGGGGNPIILLIALLAVIILAPVASMLVQAFISRRRESLADYSAVEFTRNPVGLQRALEALRDGGTAIRKPHGGTAHMWISSPMKVEGRNQQSFFGKMFATHPPLEERIEYLARMSGNSSTGVLEQ